jgi:DNA-binding GntR family transcriptional regulator
MPIAVHIIHFYRICNDIEIDMESRVERVPTDLIFTTLRDRICLLEYPPGTVLREADLAAEFGVSRTPLRAVLHQLSHGGLIESRDGVGTIVTDLTFDEIRDIYLMQMKLAELIGQMTPKTFTSEHQQAAKALYHRADQLKETFDVSEYWQINHDLHFLISTVIGNSALQEAWDHLYFQAARMWYRHVLTDPSGGVESLIAELGEVTRAIDEQDAVALGYCQRNYISYGLSRLQAAVN